VTKECLIDADTLTCKRCGARVSSTSVRRNCGDLEIDPARILQPEGVSFFGVEPPPARGPGTELSKLLKRFGIEPTPTCACRAKAAEMDAWGPDECSKPERIDEVVAVMRAEAEVRGLPFLDLAGRLLVRRAIANARRNA
jgi:hypothetical protein